MHSSLPRTLSDCGLLDFKEQVERMLSEARQEAEDIKRAGFEEGYRQGFAKGKEEGLSQISTIFLLAESMVRARETLAAELADELAKIALMAAEKVIEREVSEGREMVIDLVKRLAKELSREDRLRVLVNPDDFEIIRSAGFEVQAACDFIASPSIEAGGCVVELEGESIDARLRTRIGQIWRAVANARIH